MKSDTQSRRLGSALKLPHHNGGSTEKTQHPVDDSQVVAPPPISKAVTLSEDEQSPRYANELQEQPQNGLSDHSYWAMVEDYFGSKPANTDSNDKNNDSTSVSESSSQQVDLQKLLGDSILSISCDTATSSKASTADGCFATPDSKLSTCSVQVHPPSPLHDNPDFDSMLLSPTSSGYSLEEQASPESVAATGENFEDETQNNDTTKLFIPFSESNETTFQNITQLSLPSEPSLSPDKQSYSYLDDQQRQRQLLFEPHLSSPPAAATTTPSDPFATFRQNSTHIALTESQHYLDRIAQLEQALQQRYHSTTSTSAAAAAAAVTTRTSNIPTNETKSLWERNQTLVKEVRFADQTCVELSGQLQASCAENERLQLQLKQLQQQQQRKERAQSNAAAAAAASKQEWELQQATLTAQHEQERLQAKEQMEALQSQLQELDSSWRAKEDQMTQDYRQLQARLASTEQDEKVYQQQLEQSTQEKEALQERICELECTNHEQSERLQQMQVDHEQKTFENTLVCDQLVSAQQTILDKDQQIADLQANTQILQSKMEQSLTRATNEFKLKSDLLELQVANDMKEWQEQVARLTKAVQYLQDSLEFADSESDNNSNDEDSSCASSLTDVSEKTKSPGEATIKSSSTALNATFTDDAKDNSVDLEHMEEARLLEQDDSASEASEEQILSPPRQSSIDDDDDDTMSSIAGISHLFSLDSDQVLESYNKNNNIGMLTSKFAHASKFMSPSSSSPSLDMTKTPDGVNRQQVVALQQELAETKEALVSSLSERASLLDQLSLLGSKKEELENDLKTKVTILRESGDKCRNLEAVLGEMKLECEELKQKLDFERKRLEEERLGYERRIAILDEELKTRQSTDEEWKSEMNRVMVEKEEIQQQLDDIGTSSEQKIRMLELQVQNLDETVATKEADLKLTDEALQKSESSLGELRVSYETERKEFESEMKRLRKVQEGELHRAQEKIQVLQERDVAHESECQQFREQIAANSTREQHEIDRMKRAEKELEAFISTLKGEKKTLEMKILSLSNELAQTHRQMQDLNLKCSKDSRSVVDKEEELRRLQQALEESQSVLGSLKESYVACNEQLANYESTQREQEAELEEAKTMTRAAEDLASTAEHRFLEVQNRLQHVSTERDSLLQEKVDLEERLERAKCSLRLAEARLREQTAAHQNDISALETNHANIVSELEENLEKVEADLESNNNELNSAHHEIEGLRCMVAELTDRCRKAEALQVDLNEVSRALSSSETDRRDLVDLLSQNEQAMVELQTENNTLTTKCNRLRDYIRKLTGKCDEWEEFHEKQANVLQKLKQANERTQQKAAKLAHRLQKRDLVSSGHGFIRVIQKREDVI